MAASRLSPSSSEPDGLRGLVLLIQSFGGQVQTNVRVPGDDVRVAFLARDSLDDAGPAAVRSWVRGGGTLVVADATSSLAAPSSGEPGGFSLSRGRCDLDGVDDVRQIEIGGLDSGDLSVVGGERYQVKDKLSCFGDGTTAYVVESRARVGDHHLGRRSQPVRQRVPRQGGQQRPRHAPAPTRWRAAGGLPRPRARRARVARRCSTWCPDRVFQAFIQLGIAFLIYALWRARRLGRPVLEPQPVAIAGSQFVRAVGALEQRTRATDRAAVAIRDDVRRVARERYGLDPRAPASTLATVVADRTGLDHARIERALSDTPVLDDAALLALTNELDTIRKEMLHGS